MSLATNDGNTLLYNTHRFNLPQRRPNHSLRLPSHNESRKDSQSHNHNGDPPNMVDPVNPTVEPKMPMASNANATQSWPFRLVRHSSL